MTCKNCKYFYNAKEINFNLWQVEYKPRGADGHCWQNWWQYIGYIENINNAGPGTGYKKETDICDNKEQLNLIEYIEDESKIINV